MTRRRFGNNCIRCATVSHPFHLLPEEVVDAVAALPLQPRVVAQDRQVAHEARHLLKVARWQNLIPPRPPPWRNPRKGRDQILPSGNLVKGVTARDEVNIQYVERLLAAEKLLAESNEGEEFEAMQARLRKDREERERSRKDLQEENDLLRRLNEALSIKVKDLEDSATSMKKLPSKVGELCNFTIESPLIISYSR